MGREHGLTGWWSCKGASAVGIGLANASPTSRMAVRSTSSVGRNQVICPVCPSRRGEFGAPTKRTGLTSRTMSWALKEVEGVNSSL